MEIGTPMEVVSRPGYLTKHTALGNVIPNQGGGLTEFHTSSVGEGVAGTQEPSAVIWICLGL